MRIIFFLLTCFVASCRQKEQAVNSIPQPVVTPAKSLMVDCSDYDRKKRLAAILMNNHAIEANRQHIKMSSFIADSIISCWYGTPWNFNGCTTVPGRGSIACGYFVTTVLKDAGLQLNRIKLAQSPSGIIIHRLCNNIKLFCNQPLQNLIEYVKRFEPGLYIFGLDFHVGFIYYDGREVYFIHSSYYGPKCVVKEKAFASSVLFYSKYRKIGRVKFW